MRKLVLLSLCALIFTGLAYALLHSVPKSTPSSQQFATPGTPGATDASDQNDSTSNGFILKLDRTLADGIAGTLPSRSSAKQSNVNNTYLTPLFARQLAILAGAMLLGLFAASTLRRPTPSELTSPRPQLSENENDRHEPEEQVTHNPILLRDSNETIADDHLHSAAHAEELSAYKEQLDSRDIELEDASSRIVLLEQSIDELREELEISEQRSHAVSVTQQEQLEHFEQQSRDAHSSFSSEIEEHTEAFDRLQGEHDLLRVQLNSKIKEISVVQQEIDSSNARSEYLEQQLTSALSDSKEQLSLIEELQESKSSLSSQVAELVPQAALAVERNDELNDLNSSYNNLRDTYDELVSSFKSLQTELEAAHERVRTADELDTQVNTLVRDIEQVETARDEYITELREVHTLFNQAQARATQADKFEEQISQLLLDLATMTKSRDASEEQVYTLNSELAQQIKQLEINNAERNELGSKATQALKSLESSESKLDVTLQDLAVAKEQLAQEKTALTELQQRHIALEQDQQELKTQLNELNEAHGELQTENSVFSESVELLREDLADMVRKTGEKNKQIGETQEQVSDQKRHIAAQQSEIESLLTTIEEEHQQVEALTQQVKEANITEQRLATWDNSLDTYRNDISSKNRLIDELRDGVTEAWDRSASFKQQTQKLEEQLQVYTDVASQLEQAQSQIIDLTALIANQDKLIEQLSEQMHTHNSRVDDFHTNLEQLDDERQYWQQELSLKTNTAIELEVELLDQHETLMSMEELLEASQVHFMPLGDDEHLSLESTEATPAMADSEQPANALLRKGAALVAQLRRAVSINSHLLSDKDELHARLTASDSKVKEQQAAGEKQSREFLAIEQQFREQIATASNQHQKLLEELEELKEARDIISSQAEEQAEAQAQQLHQLQETLSQEQQKHQLATQELSKAEEAWVETDTAYKAARTAVDELEADKQRLQESLETAAEEVQQHQLTHESALQKLTETQHTKTELDNELHAVREEAEQLQLTYQSASKQLAEIESAKIELENELIVAREEAQEHQLAYQSASKQLAEAETTTIKLGNELHAAQDEAQKHQLAHQTALQALAEAENSKVDLDGELHTAQLLINSQGAENDTLRSSVNAALEEAEQHQLAHETTLQKLLEAENAKIVLESEVQAAETSINSKDAENEAMRMSIDTAMEKVQRKQAAKERAEHELSKLETALTDAKRSSQQKQAEFNELKAARDDALRQLAVQKERVTATEQTLTAALTKQRDSADQLRAALKAEREKTAQASDVPILTQKVAAGSAPTSIPVLGQPVAGGSPPPVDDELPVLNQPLGPRKS